MKLYVKQMQNWNCYAYCAEEVDKSHWGYFQSELWWQLGDSFIKTYDNVKDFEYCAENFRKYGERSILQQLKILPAPWETALENLIPEMKKIGVDWFLHGSAAMALWGIDVTPKDINIIIPNASDFDRVRDHFYQRAIKPFERCDNWVMSGLGTIFAEANIGFAFFNPELEPYDMSGHDKLGFHGETVAVSTLDMLRQDNENYGRPERVDLIDETIRQTSQEGGET